MTICTIQPRVQIVLGCFFVLFSVGCASEKEHRMGLFKGRDPLMGEKIPSPNVPVGKDAYGLKDTRDPLIRADAGRTNPEPAAALVTGRRDMEQSDLRIADIRRPVGGLSARESGNTAEQMNSEVKRIGGRVSSPTRTDNGGYEVRVQVPNGPSGAMTGYVGTGNTAAAALNDAYDQVRNERK
jgi:hypothetical protein